MMSNKNFKVIVLIATVAILQLSCTKIDSESERSNPTNGKTFAIFNPTVSYGTMTDQDGNVYKTVIIGSQTWMAENLRTTKYSDGKAIPNVTDNEIWNNQTTGAYCNYNNTSSTGNIATYGRLYNWHAVRSGKLSPPGWRIPNNADWKTLIDYLGGNEAAAGKLKETGDSHWAGSSSDVTNISGFTALPGGIRYYDGFYGFSDEGTWWSDSEDLASGLAYYQNIFSWSNGVRQHYHSKITGMSVRCVQ